jgi:hypothetical protein
MTLGSTQPLTEMSTRNISWWVKAASTSWNPQGLYSVCFTFFYRFYSREDVELLFEDHSILYFRYDVN